MLGPYKVAGFTIIGKKDGKVRDHFMFKRHGAREWVENNTSVLFSGPGSSLEYRKKLDMMRQVCEMIGDAYIVEDIEERKEG